MNEQFHEAFDALWKSSSSLSKREQEVLVPILYALSEWLSNSRTSSRIEADAAKLAKYVEKLGPARSESGREAELLYVLLRSKSPALHKIPRVKMRSVQKFFWTLLEAHAEEWDSRELSNVLAYSLGNNLRPESELPPRNLVKAQRKYFDALPVEHRDQLFDELLRRVATSSSFRDALQAEASSR